MPRDLSLTGIGFQPDDRDAQTIFDDALASAQTLMPEWQPRNGDVAVLLLEALAVAASDMIYAANRIPGVVLEALLSLFGVDRSPGAPATGTVTLTLDQARDLTVTAGQRLGDPTTALTLQVTADTTGTAVTSLTVPVATVESSALGNTITAGTVLDLLDSIPYVTAAQAATTFTGGVDAEDDAAFLDRASTVLARNTSSLVLPDQLAAYCLGDVRVARAHAVDLYYPGGSVGTNAGHCTVYVYGKSGPLGTDILGELEDAMQAASPAMLQVHVAAATITTQAVTVTVKALAGWSAIAVRDAVAAKIAAWLDPSVWTWDAPIVKNDIIVLAGTVPGVESVTSVTVPAAASTAIGTPGGLAKAGTITVTVT